MSTMDRIDAEEFRMDRHAPHRSGIALMGLLVSVATSSCDQSESSGGVSTGGQGGLGSFAGATAEGTGGSQVGGPIGGSGGGQAGANGSGVLVASGSSGLVGGGGSFGTLATGGQVTSAGSSPLGGTPNSGGTTGPGATGGNATGGGAITMGGSAQGGIAGGGSVTKGGTAGSNTGGAAPTGGAGGEACVASLRDYCGCMPRFVGAQVVDGAGDEFLALPPTTFALSTAPYLNPSRSSPLPERVTLRAGWSDVALHVHVHVDDPSIIPDPNASLWNGDNVQLFVAPTDNLTGTYTGTEDGGAIHVLISAPDAADVSHAIVIYQNGVATNTPFVTGLFAARRVTGGYQIEAQLQWLPIANPLRSGARIGFDLLVGAASDPSQGLTLEGGLANNLVSAPSPACALGGRIQPGCDDRTWCTPVLE